ncbi:MAG: Rieske (2Fe-2S) protein [Gemmatimonadetes bacterium]|nr:Rieske (2Fe-2S) protein [Gemmatimonadota bacterium]
MGDCVRCPVDDERRSLLRLAGALMALGMTELLPIRALRALESGAESVTYPIPATDSVQIDKDQELILVRWEHFVYVFDLSCPHQSVSLRWNGVDKRFQCPKHKSQYSPSGIYIEGRATRSMDRLAIKRVGNTVVVELDKLLKEDENAAEWKAAAIPV